MTMTTPRALDRELMLLLRSAGKPRTLPELFDGLRPRWAETATERLEIAGHVRELAGDKLELLPSGRALVELVVS